MKSQIINIIFRLLTLLILIPGVIYLSVGLKFKDHIKNYQYVANNMILGIFNPDQIKELDKSSPHFMRIDFIKMQTYLMYFSGKDFDQTLFNIKLLETRKYNRYYEPQIHVSSQYYSFINDDKNLLEVYSDFLYYLLVREQIIRISVSNNNIAVRINDEKNISIVESNGTYILFIPKALFENLKRVNSSFGTTKLSEDFFIQVLSNFTYNGSGDAVKAKMISKAFFDGINRFSQKFFFK